jgi:hypothetical protein
MRSSARRQPSATEARLSARIEALEARVRQLERQLRGAATPAHTPVPTKGEGPPGPRKQGRARPRCPGCMLEVPRGRRRETCVWCGFHFAAVRPRRKTKA